MWRDRNDSVGGFRYCDVTDGVKGCDVPGADRTSFYREMGKTGTVDGRSLTRSRGLDKC